MGKDDVVKGFSNSKVNVLFLYFVGVKQNF